MFFIQKIFPQHWRFLPDNSFTRLNLLYKTNLSQSMQWTDCPILTASVLLLCPSLGLLLTLLSALPSFHLANRLHLLASFGSQPSPTLCISMSVCLCLYLSVCLSASVHALCCRLMFRILKFLILPLPISPCLLAFSISSIRWVLYAKFKSAVCL